jgi:AcrR family transcriptional regulator
MRAVQRTRAGRPRDSSLDARAIAATLQLLVEEGFEGTTVQAVARRSGVHASALYRRWPSRIELIEDAIFPGFDPPTVAPTGDLRADLTRFLQAYLLAFGSPAARAAAPGLMAHHQAAGGRSPEHYLRVSARPQFQEILRAAPNRSVDPDLDPDDVFDILLGAIFARTVVPTIVARRPPLKRTVDLLIRMLRPMDEVDSEEPSHERPRRRETRRGGRERH